MQPRKAPKLKTFPVRVLLVLTVNGEPKGALPLEAEIDAPPDGQGKQINFPLDARALQQMTAALCGDAQPASKLWTPKGDKPLRIVH